MKKKLRNLEIFFSFGSINKCKEICNFFSRFAYNRVNKTKTTTMNNMTLVSTLVKEFAMQTWFDLLDLLKKAQEDFEGTEYEFFNELKNEVLMDTFNYGEDNSVLYFDFNYGCLNGTMYYDLKSKQTALGKQFDIWVDGFNAPIATVTLGYKDGKFTYNELWVYDESVSDKVAVKR